MKWKDMMEKQAGRKIKELQIGNIKRYKDQFFTIWPEHWYWYLLHKWITWVG